MYVELGIMVAKECVQNLSLLTVSNTTTVYDGRSFFKQLSILISIKFFLRMMNSSLSYFSSSRFEYLCLIFTEKFNGIKRVSCHRDFSDDKFKKTIFCTEVTCKPKGFVAKREE